MPAFFFSDVEHLELMSTSGWRSWPGCLVASVLIESADQAMSVISWWYPHRVEGLLLAKVLLVVERVGSRRSGRRTRLGGGGGGGMVRGVMPANASWWWQYGASDVIRRVFAVEYAPLS
jgi:hypothetical protein